MDAYAYLPDRAVVSVTGEDATKLLAGLVTNGPPKAGALFSTLLTPQGKILFDFHIVANTRGYWFDIHGDAAEGFAKRLTLYRLRAKADIAVEPGMRVCVKEDADAAGDPSARMILPADDATKPVEIAQHEARRIAAGVPQWGADFESDDVFPMDVNYDLLAGVDYKKGCFVGQEVASRMKRKGSARKRTLIAKFNGAAPEKGTPIVAGGSTLGEIMSGVDGAALALIRLDRWEKAMEAGDAVAAGDTSLTLSHPAYMEN